MKLAIVSTHPIQYYAPVFRELANYPGLDVKVFYGWKGATEVTRDVGFGQSFAWDIPLLDGYQHEFVPNIAETPGTHRFDAINCPSMNQRIAEWQADAVLIYGWSWKAHLAAIRHFSGKIPVYFRGDSTLLGERGGLRKFARRLWLGWIYRHIDTAFYVGSHNKRYFLAHGLKEHQLCFAPHAIANHQFADPTGALQNEASQWRGELGIPLDSLAYLFCGKLEDQKCPQDLVSTFRNRQEHLILAGSGPLEQELRNMASANVHFIGFQNQSRMPVVYRLADVVILPSRNETWGLAINEAMACSRPVITSDQVGCAEDLVIPDSTGWVFPVGAVDQLQQILNKISTLDRATLTQWGENSLAVIDKWSVSVQARCIANHVLNSSSE